MMAMCCSTPSCSHKHLKNSEVMRLSLSDMMSFGRPVIWRQLWMKIRARLCAVRPCLRVGVAIM